MLNPLIVVTTYNKLGMTKRTAEYFMDLGYDLLYIDDCSIDGTQEYLTQIKVRCFLKNERRGLTDSWNMAYRFWKMERKYTHLILCNNDVIIPHGAIEKMIGPYSLTVPLCNHEGAGYACKFQSIKNYIPDLILEGSQDIQNFLMMGGFKKADCWTGFCMCLSRQIEYYERDDFNLWDPQTVNVGNDDYLAKWVTAYVALGAYVHHFKGVSFNKQIAGRDDLRRDYI